MKNVVMVVEDNPPSRELLSDWLEVEGYSVQAVESLEQAFALLNDHQFHAILLDVQLGLEDGLDLARWIRKDPKLRSTPVIAVTAHAMVTDQARVLQAGCNVCVSKPIDFNLLKSYLSSYVSSWESDK